VKTFFLKKSEQQIHTVTRLTRINLIDVKNQFHSTRIHYVLDFLRFYPCEKILKSQQTHHVRYTIIDSSDFIVVSILNSAWWWSIDWDFHMRVSNRKSQIESLKSKVSNRKSQSFRPDPDRIDHHQGQVDPVNSIAMGIKKNRLSTYLRLNNHCRIVFWYCPFRSSLNIRYVTYGMLHTVFT